MRKALGAVLLAVVVLATAAFIAVRPDRPPRSDLKAVLFEGLSYQREARDTPRPLLIHVVEIDLTEPGVSFLVTPGKPWPGLDLPPRTTSQFLAEFGVQVAVNGGFFEPARGPSPEDGIIQGEDLLDVWGLAISDGQVYSDDNPRFPVLCLSGAGAQIERNGCPEETRNALAGSPLLVERGEPAWSSIARYRRALHPRTAVAINEAGDMLWLIVVDGRQPNYSEGVTLDELAQLALDLGAHTALNLDGGGSTTLVVEGAHGPRVLNSPIHRRIPLRQRPVGNHLGVYAQPMADLQSPAASGPVATQPFSYSRRATLAGPWSALAKPGVRRP